MTARKVITSLILTLLRLIGPGKKPPIGDFAPKRIAMLRFGGFGDMVAVTGLLRAARKTWPDAHIDFITDQASTTVMENNPDADRIIVGQKPGGGWSIGTVLRSFTDMRRWSRQSYDLAFFMHHDFANEFLPVFFRSRFKTGFDIDERGFDFAYTHSTCVYSPSHPKVDEHITTHFTSHYQRLLHAVTGRDHPLEMPVIQLSDAEISAAQRFVNDRGIDKRLVVIAPGGTDPIKIWPIERYADVARKLVTEHDASVMVMLGPAEAAYEIHFQDLGDRFVFDAGGNSFRENMAICGQASAMVCNDTGLMHVAAALGVPAAAIFGATPAAVFGYGNAGHDIITADLPCIPCNTWFCRLLPEERRGELPPCLDEVSADRVAGAAAHILVGRSIS